MRTRMAMMVTTTMIMLFLLFLVSLGCLLLHSGHGRFVGAFMIQSSSGSIVPSRFHQRTTNDCGIKILPPFSSSSSSEIYLRLSRDDDSNDEYETDENISNNFDGSTDDDIETHTKPEFDWEYLFECIYGEGGEEEQWSLPTDNIDGSSSFSSSTMDSTGSIEEHSSLSSSEHRRNPWLLSDDGALSFLSVSSMMSPSSREHHYQQQQKREHLPEHVYIVMFNSPFSSQNGALSKDRHDFDHKTDPKSLSPTTKEHYMHAVEHPKGSGNNVILAFESYVSCRKFALMLSQSTSSSKIKTGKLFDFSDPAVRTSSLQFFHCVFFFLSCCSCPLETHQDFQFRFVFCS